MHRKFGDSYRFGKIRMRKNAENGIWQMKFREPRTGNWMERSTGTTLKREAEDIAGETSRRLIDQTYGNVRGTIPLADLFQKFLEAKQLSLKPRSRTRLGSTITNFNEWISEVSVKIIQAQDVTPERVREFQKYRMETKKRSSRTVDNDIANLCTIFKWAKKEMLVPSNPADYSKATGRVERIRAAVPPKAVYTHEEVRGLLAEAERRGDDLIRDLIVVYAGTGMRFEEVAHMTPEWLDWTGQPSITVRAHDGWSPKSKHEVKRIPMLPDVQEVLQRRSKGCAGFLFKNNAGKGIVERKALDRLKRLFPAVKIDPEKRKLHWHSFRRYFVKRCMEAGAPLNVLMSWTGHDAVSMALEYGRASYEDSVRAMQRLTPNISSAA